MDIAGFMVPIMTSVQPGWPKFASFDFSHLSGHENRAEGRDENQ